MAHKQILFRSAAGKNVLRGAAGDSQTGNGDEARLRALPAKTAE